MYIWGVGTWAIDDHWQRNRSFQSLDQQLRAEHVRVSGDGEHADQVEEQTNSMVLAELFGQCGNFLGSLLASLGLRKVLQSEPFSLESRANRQQPQVVDKSRYGRNGQQGKSGGWNRVWGSETNNYRTNRLGQEMDRKQLGLQKTKLLTWQHLESSHGRDERVERGRTKNIGSVVGSRGVITATFWRVSAHKHRARVVDLVDVLLGLFDLQDQVLRSVSVAHVQSVVIRFDCDRGRVGNTLAHNIDPRQLEGLAVDSVVDLVDLLGCHVHGDQNHLRVDTVFCLGQQVRGNKVWVGVLVGDNEHLRRPSRHVDGTHGARVVRNKHLGSSDKLVTRSHDLVALWHRLCSIGHCSNSLRTSSKNNTLSSHLVCNQKTPGHVSTVRVSVWFWAAWNFLMLAKEMSMASLMSSVTFIISSGNGAFSTGEASSTLSNLAVSSTNAESPSFLTFSTIGVTRFMMSADFWIGLCKHWSISALVAVVASTRPITIRADSSTFFGSGLVSFFGSSLTYFGLASPFLLVTFNDLRSRFLSISVNETSYLTHLVRAK
ncbi:hypothetical protein OGAPHI_004966 [Ogataea philodendri]|uniref:Uncharacterized protein n=1 Tax=Ogataea philodendri TaxID=1378263 RepID=A0A9P8P1T0_9ASCO|nr:uncharacterized protein OGAPHI_004966 [Ogataea philodendri]KAH3663565.1 hypothetical protein OGAPHI_004966 [Ogataea philodendri]